MKNIVDRLAVWGKTVGNALVAVFALVVGTTTSSAADWTDANNVNYSALKSIHRQGAGAV